MAISRFDVYLVRLDPTVGSEIQKTRPCVVVSPNELNRHSRTLIIVPMTSKGKAYPTRISCRFQGKQGLIVIDQLRAVDRTRLFRKLGRLNRKDSTRVLDVLQELFAP
jgi:mRNA interferase MazF